VLTTRPLPEQLVERELVTAHFENEHKMEKKWRAPEARTCSQINYYTLVENEPGKIWASGTGHSHRVTMGSEGPLNPAVRGLYPVIKTGGIIAVRLMVIREHRENLGLNRYYDEDGYDSCGSGIGDDYDGY
jgi:hypothetical protein